MLLSLRPFVENFLRFLPRHLCEYVYDQNKKRLRSSSVLSFLVNQRRTLFFFQSFFPNQSSLLHNLSHTLSLRLRLRGMGYYFAKRNGILFLITGTSHALSFYLPKNFSSRVLGKRSRLLILAASANADLQQFLSLLRRFVIYDIYRIKGIFPLGSSFFKRSGKKKFM